LDHVKSGADKFYLLIAAVIMPDHVHVLIQPLDTFDLSRICKGMKGVSARLVNQSRRVNGYLWQDESWDRIMRNQDELDEKLQYMLDNPVRKGLISDGWLYPWWYYNEGWKGNE
jgi:REP element-mobilizing transposase RayT